MPFALVHGTMRAREFWLSVSVKGNILKLKLLHRIVGIVLSLPMLVPAARAEQPLFLASEAWKASTLHSSQVIVVQAGEGVSATLSLWHEKDGQWGLAGGPWSAVIGKNGMAQSGQKKEGDGKTPAGLFSIAFAFGEAKQATTALPYRMASDQDIWVDDPASPLYNQWTQLPTTAHSFERMKRKDTLYKLGLVVDYNQNPVVPGAGSAIFIHVWRSPIKGTAGCAALAEENLRALVAALRPEDKPVALFLP